MFSFPSSASASATGLFSAYASVAASAMLVRSMANEIVPAEIRAYIATAVRRLFTPLSSDVTFTVDEFSGMSRNEVFDAAELYLRTKIPPSASRLRVAKLPRQKSVAVSADQGERISDDFDGVRVTWKLVCTQPEKNSHNLGVKRHFEVTADRRFRDKVVEAYLPYVLRKAESIRLEDRVIKLYSRDCPFNDSNDRGRGGGRGGGLWGSVSFEHPATFDTLAMDPGLKRAVIEDLDRFLRRREFYKRVGRAWKRGYLLFGPPGTGKSSLIAAMANYLKFDVYDLELTGIYSNSELRRTLLATSNRSILVIEDIDCSAELKNRSDCDSDGDNGFYGGVSNTTKLTLSGLLNFIDGLWSSCGDERIIVFTTNHKDRLDPALLRPGRMDMHINMSYCTKDGFKTLASNYLGLQGNGHRLCGEIEGLIGETEVTPAEVAEELMKSDDSDVVLGGLVDFLKRKRVEAIEKEQKAAENNGGGEQEMKGGDEEEEEIVPPKSKKVKLGVNRGACRNIGRMVVRGRLRRGF